MSRRGGMGLLKGIGGCYGAEIRLWSWVSLSSMGWHSVPSSLS